MAIEGKKFAEKLQSLHPLAIAASQGFKVWPRMSYYAAENVFNSEKRLTWTLIIVTNATVMAGTEFELRKKN